MKKAIALALLATTVLSGCAVYPSGYTSNGYNNNSYNSGYSNYSNFDYDYGATSGVVYYDQSYVTPGTNVWINNPRYNRHDRYDRNDRYPRGNHYGGDRNNWNNGNNGNNPRGEHGNNDNHGGNRPGRGDVNNNAGNRPPQATLPNRPSRPDNNGGTALHRAMNQAATEARGNAANGDTKVNR